MKTIEEFLLDLSRLDIKLWLEEDRLRCNAPKGVLTPEIRTHLSDRKPEIIDFLQQINVNSNSSFESISPVSRNQDLPLSFAQQRLWFLDRLEGGNSTYNLPLTLEITGNLNITALEQAIREIFRRHEILRTRIAIVNDQPIQVIDPEITLEINFNLPLTDLQSLPSAAKLTTVKQLATQEGDKPFELIDGRLVRFHLWKLSGQSHVLLINMHHIVSDGWSMGIFIQELSAFYQTFDSGSATCKDVACYVSTGLPELSIQYADFAVWQQQYLQGEVLEKQLKYWKQQLADAPPLLELPTDRPRPAVQSFRGGVVEFQLDSDLTESLKNLSQKSGVTLFMTMLAAFVTLLFRYSSQDDICIGSPVANRNRKEIEPLIGFFVNTLVLRFQLGENFSFSDLLNLVKKVAADGQTHQDVPFEQVVEALQPQRNLSYSPLFQVLFDLQYDSMEQLEFPGLTVNPLQTEIVTSKFDLSLVIEDKRNYLRGWWEYSSDLFNVDTINRMTGHFQTLLTAIVANPEESISTLPLLTPKEQHQLLVEWNSQKSDFPRDRCIHELFESQVKRTPEHIALEFGSETLTYQELNRRADLLAHHLRTLGVKVDVLVGLCVERSVEMIVGLLGILKAGGAYLPLDPTYPRERLAHMVHDSGVSVLLTQQKLVNLLPKSSAKVVYLDRDIICRDATCRVSTVVSKVKPNNLAYIIYTSGSTGKPKGVMVSHQAIVNHATAAIAEYGLTNRDLVLQFASFSFDVALEEIFPTLLSGGTLVMRPAEIFSSFADFSRFIEQKSLTVVNIPTPYWQEWVLEISQGKSTIPRNLRLLVTGSEQVLPERLALWQKLVGDRVMWINAYGPTEATITATVYKPETSSKHSYNNSVSIGRPIANTEIYILDKHLQAVPIGVPGELHIGGVGLASGYLNLPELTEQKFIQNPFLKSKEAEQNINYKLLPITHYLLPITNSKLYKTGDSVRYLSDGNIEFLGRIDNQVKIRGFRIELGEIEALLAQNSLVRASAVVVREDQSGNKQIVAYIVPNKQSLKNCARYSQSETENKNEKKNIIQSQIRGFLKQKLPDYMVPAIFTILDELPLTPNGKVNRRALPTPSVSQPDNLVHPRTDTEKTVAKVWSDVLGIKQISIDDNFFELGGHSLRATQVMSRLQEAGKFKTKLELPLRYLFEEPTIAGLAALIDTKITTNTDTTNKDTTNTEENYRKDAVLDPSIQPQLLPFEYLSQPKNILLTGATGFVGAYLLQELLEQTEADIYCLIRSQNLEQAKQKLQTKLESYSLSNVNKNHRIIPVVGDLSKKLLGLSPLQFHDLASQIDVIYHNAAWINTIYPYSILKPSNVLGTQEILRLASEIKLKPVHYISTTSVFSPLAYSQTNLVLESDPLEKTEGLEGGYPQSKWVAEKLVMQARDRGLPVSIYRLARVTGHSQTGVCNTDDLFCRLIKGCIQMGIAPEMNGIIDNLTPVDYVSKAITHLSQQKESLGKAFHLLNPHSTPMNQLFKSIAALGYPLKQVPYQQWLDRLVRESHLDSGNVLQPLIALYSQSTTESVPEPQFDRTNTDLGLADTGIVFPPMEQNLLKTYFSYFINSGFLISTPPH